jgi:hypothetical protein
MNQLLKTNVIRLLALSAAYSAPLYSSDYTYGYSNNAAVGNGSWSMSSSVLGVPSVEGVDVNAVIYRYTAIKNQGDPFTVSVQNKAADGSGYIFRSTDDWTRGSGGTINKYVPVPYSPLGNWGTGSIEQVGIGSVEEPQVVYSYRYKEPEIDPLEYLPAPTEVEVYDALADESLPEATDSEIYDKAREETVEKLKEPEKASEDSTEHDPVMYALTSMTNMNQYYAVSMSGGVYPETIQLVDANLPDNRRALRNSQAQQKLHKELVDSQY